MTSVDYSIVRFSPVPEEVEAVNVAVLLWDRPPRLLFDSDFPRLAAITSRFDRTLLRAYLDHLLDQLMSSGELPLGISSQIQFTSRRRLFSPLTSDTEQRLELAYLTKASAQRKASVKAEQARVEAELDGFLTSRLFVPPSEIRRRSRPVDFLPRELAMRFFPDDGMRFGRVIAGRRDVLVIDSISRLSPISTLEKRSTRIGAGFVALDPVKELLLERHDKHLYRSVVFFGPRPIPSSPRLEYFEHGLKSVSDMTEEALGPSPELMRVARQAAMDLV